MGMDSQKKQNKVKKETFVEAKLLRIKLNNREIIHKEILAIMKKQLGYAILIGWACWVDAERGNYM